MTWWKRKPAPPEPEPFPLDELFDWIERVADDESDGVKVTAGAKWLLATDGAARASIRESIDYTTSLRLNGVNIPLCADDQKQCNEFIARMHELQQEADREQAAALVRGLVKSRVE